jgi:hypothetical protein
MNYLIKHGTKGFYSNGSWISRMNNVSYATRFDTIDKAIEMFKTLKSLDNTPLQSCNIISIERNEFGYSFKLFARVRNAGEIIERYENGISQLS